MMGKKKVIKGESIQKKIKKIKVYKKNSYRYLEIVPYKGYGSKYLHVHAKDPQRAAGLPPL